MADQPRHLAAPRDPDGRMVAILVAGFAAALLLGAAVGGMLGDLNATPRGRAPAVTVAAVAPAVTVGIAGRRAGDVGKTPPPTSRPTAALTAWTPTSTSTTVPDPRSKDLGSSTTAPATSSSSTPTTAPPGSSSSSSTAPPETSRGSDEAGPTPSSTTSPTVPPATSTSPAARRNHGH